MSEGRGPDGLLRGPVFAAPAAAAPAPPVPARRRRTRLAVAAAVVVVLAVTGAAVALRRGGPSTASGDASPAAVVRRALAAAAAGDVDRLLALVVPAEARPLRALAAAAPASLVRGALAGAAGVPAPGPSTNSTEPRLRTDRPAPDLALVTIDGGPSALAVVRRHGRWYLSPTTTVLEAARLRFHLAAPDFTPTGPRPAGAARAQDVLAALAATVRAHDLPRAAGLISQQELPELRAYYPVFAFELGLGLTRERESVTAVTTTTRPMSDGLTKVLVETVTTSTGRRYRDGCLSGTPPRCVPPAVRSLTGLSTPFVVVGREEGTWRIKPVATVVEYLRTVLADGDRAALLRYLSGR
jgi:hypothetical protein